MNATIQFYTGVEEEDIYIARTNTSQGILEIHSKKDNKLIYHEGGLSDILPNENINLIEPILPSINKRTPIEILSLAQEIKTLAPSFTSVIDKLLDSCGKNKLRYPNGLLIGFINLPTEIEIVTPAGFNLQTIFPFNTMSIGDKMQLLNYISLTIEEVMIIDKKYYPNSYLEYPSYLFLNSVKDTIARSLFIKLYQYIVTTRFNIM
jgi:hypothetical protein